MRTSVISFVHPKASISKDLPEIYGKVTASQPAAIHDAGWAQFTGGPQPKADILSFGSTHTDAGGHLNIAWDKPGDTVRFEMKVRVQGDMKKVRPELWTNANHNADPQHYHAEPMKLVKSQGGVATYAIDLPLYEVGNFKASARISTNGGQSHQWVGSKGISDVRFRVRDEKHDNLNIELTNVGMANYDQATGRYGTFADMMDSGSPKTNGKYTLEWLKEQGVNSLWLQPIFENAKWDKSHPMDKAGSPYAAKDFFSVRTELSRAAQGKTGVAAKKAALEEFRAFKDKCEELGIKVLLDVALNHVGHNYEMSDLFVSHDPDGNEIREVRQNDYSQVATSPQQLADIDEKLEDLEAKGLDYMEYAAPHMYGKYNDAHGAKSVNETVPGGFFEWPDVKQLNHGRMRHGYHWWDANPTAESNKVNEYLERVLKFWAVDMGVDGFRIDHLTGMPERFLAETLNRVQDDVDHHDSGRSVFLVGEDFHTSNTTRHWLDAGQGGWFHEFRKCKDPQHMRSIVENTHFHDLLAPGSHDETRFITASNDHRSSGRMLALLQLLGGPSLAVVGDEFGEQAKLAFKQYKGVASLRAPNGHAMDVAKVKGRAGRAKNKLAALQDDNRYWLSPTKGGQDKKLLAMARYADDKSENPVLVFGNFDNGATRHNRFELDPKTRERIDPNAYYNVYDAMSDKPNKAVWTKPKKGSDLIEQGVYARLGAYQVQVLELRKQG